MKKKIIIISTIIFVILACIILLKFINPNKNNILSNLNVDNVSNKDLKEATLTFYLEDRDRDSTVTREVLDAVESKSKSELNVKLNFKFEFANPVSYLDTIKTAISSGQPCDAFVYYSNFSSQSLKSMADEGLIKDLTTLFPEKAPDYYRQFSKDAIKAMSINGKIYAIPRNISNSVMQSAIVREDLMEKYNIPEIKSYEDYESYLKTIKGKEPDLIPVLFDQSILGLFAEADGYIIFDSAERLVYKQNDPDMKIIPWEQTPEFKKDINTIRKWFANGYMLKNVGGSFIGEDQFTSGKYSSFISTFGNEIWYNTISANRKIPWRYKAYRLNQKNSYTRNSPLEGAFAVIDKSQNADRVLMFINWLQSSQENYDSLMYGIKGKHYTIVDNKMKIPDNISFDKTNYFWTWSYPLTNIKYERVNWLNDEATVKETYKIIDSNTKYPPHMGFTPDYAPVAEIASLRPNTYNNMENSIYAEGFSPGTVDEFVKSCRDEGSDKLVSEIQRQLDKWKTENVSSN